MPAKLSPRISINFQNKLSPRSSPVKSFGSRHKDSARPVWERTDVVRGAEERKNEGQNVLDLETWKNICGRDRSASGTLELIRRHCLGPRLPSSPRYSEYAESNTSPSPSTNSPVPPTTISQTQSPRSYEAHRSSPISQTQSPRIQEMHTSQSKEAHCLGPAMIAKTHKTRGCSPEAATPERPPRRPYQRYGILGMGSNSSPIRTGCDPWTGESGDPGEGQTPDRARKCLEQSFQRAEPQRPSIRRNNSSRNNQSSAEKIKAFYSSSSSSSSRSNSPEPPPPPQNPIVPPEKLEQDFFPPPPGFSTLKRISSECSRTRRQRIRSPLKEQDISNSPLREHAFDLTRSSRKKMEESNPDSPSRTAAKEAAGWEKFHGRRSVSVTLTAEEAEIIRVRRRQEIRRPPSPPQSPVSEEAAPPPLPPKPRHKLSEIGSPNSENFIVMDNSAAFSRRSSPVLRTSFEASAEDSIISRLSPPVGLCQPERSLPDLANNLDEAAGDVVDDQADHQRAEILHCRSDSGLSSMSERTSAMSPMSGLSVPFRATSSSSSSRASVRSSSIVSSCSIPLEEMLGEGEAGGSPRMSEMKVAATNKAILEKVKYFENEKSTAANKAILEKVKYFENESSRRKLPVQKRRGTKELKERRDSIKEETVKCVEDEDLDVTVAPEPSQAGGSPTTTKDSGVQRQLDTIKLQKENLIREIVINENLGLAITEKIELAATYKEMDKYRIFVTELDKILSLLLSLGSRLQRAEGDLCNKNMTDYEKERIRFHRDKLNRQLGEAQDIKKNSDRRMANIVLFMQKYLAEEEVDNFKMYIKQKEELLKMQRAYEDSEKTILHCF